MLYYMDSYVILAVMKTKDEISSMVDAVKLISDNVDDETYQKILEGLFASSPAFDYKEIEDYDVGYRFNEEIEC